MPTVTVIGAGGTTPTLNFNSSAAAAVAQNLINTINADIASGKDSVYRVGIDPTPTAAAPGGGTWVAEFVTGSPTNATVPSAFVGDIINTLGVPITVTDPENVISGATTGGITYNQTLAGGMIVTGGGQNNITLAAGATTVSLDITPSSTVSGVAIGTSTVNALAGGAFITVNANTNTTSALNNGLILAAKNDTIVMAGSGAIGVADSTVVVSVLGGGAAFLAGTPINIKAGPGTAVIGVLPGVAGTSETITGGSSGTLQVTTPTVTGVSGVGSAFINANGENVVVFSGAQSTTLFGGTGSDSVFGATGLLKAGSGGNSLLIAGGAGTTLFGGGSGDTLFGATAGSNTYGAATGSVLTIQNFGVTDFFKLSSGQTVASVSGGGSAASLVTLSDGTKITVADGIVTTSNSSTFFHS